MQYCYNTSIKKQKNNVINTSFLPHVLILPGSGGNEQVYLLLQACLYLCSEICHLFVMINFLVTVAG